MKRLIFFYFTLIMVFYNNSVVCQKISPFAFEVRKSKLGLSEINLQRISVMQLEFTGKRYQPKIIKNRLYLVPGVSIAGMAGVYAAFIKPWWSGEKQGFRIKFDWINNYWLEMDKLGHFYSNIQATRLSAAMFQFAGVSRKKALWIGFANSTLLYTAFELTDAGFADWGFSVPDVVANLLGAFYPIAQEYYPLLKHFNFKMSYAPSKFFQNPDVADTPGFINYHPHQYLVGDYDGMKYWLSTDVNWMLPSNLKSVWPDWLNIAGGYSAYNLPQANHAIKERRFYISLDCNLEKLPGNSSFLKTLKSILNTIHLPAPAVHFSSHGRIKFYWLNY